MQKRKHPVACTAEMGLPLNRPLPDSMLVCKFPTVPHPGRVLGPSTWPPSVVPLIINPASAETTNLDGEPGSIELGTLLCFRPTTAQLKHMLNAELRLVADIRQANGLPAKSGRLLEKPSGPPSDQTRTHEFEPRG
ncbi:hypothetical protein VTJ04DRAFT_2979 [Mycothermus thermophilus]|uniref:uncharacterized protein n=1 Tax=Humicola insolens TaxID=85995 RepID=UPI0037444F74